MNNLRCITGLLFLLGMGTEGATGPQTFCNPLNIDYGWNAKGYRHSADPVIVLFKDRYYLFATDDLPGYRVSGDLLSWTNILFNAELRPLMSDNNRGTYCAPAAAADANYLYFIRMSRRAGPKVPVMRSSDPSSGRWEKCGELRATADPTLFFDEGRAWIYHGLGQPTKVFEVSTNTWTEVPGSERQLRPAITNLAEFFGGYERGRRELTDEVSTGPWWDRFAILPCQEAAWMTRVKNRYYLQYATPGTVTHWYCDTVMEGDSPLGPFRHVPYAPASMKIGGFMGSAGHSCVFQDRHGNWWRISTMWVGVHDLFERRLGLFPVVFDESGRMRTLTALGDYPQVLPDAQRPKDFNPHAGWWVQSFRKRCRASSSMAGHQPEMAADENCRTWWSAETGTRGEWFEMDLGAATRVDAIQVNFAEQDCLPVSETTPIKGDSHRYRLSASADGNNWHPIIADGGREKSYDSIREAVGPHDYVPLGKPETIRWLKVECVAMPAGGKFAIRDLRAFGQSRTEAPGPVAAPQVVRNLTDDRNATISWRGVPGADGYLVRFGLSPDHLFHSIQVQGGTNTVLTTHALNRGIDYFWRVDAYNGQGLAPGQPTPSADRRTRSKAF